MKKDIQRNINLRIDNVIDSINEQLEHDCRYIGRFRTCNASLYETSDYICLKSYNTIVAAVSKETKTGYDFLRKVYGYTSTTAQHISKFFNEYAEYALRWYYVEEKKED